MLPTSDNREEVYLQTHACKVASALAKMGVVGTLLHAAKIGAQSGFLTWIHAYPQKQEVASLAFDKVVGSGSPFLYYL